jgi:hypothetical protein
VSQGEAAVRILLGFDDWANEHNDGIPKWIVWGDLGLLHHIRDMAGLPQRGPATCRLVCDALGKYAAREDTKLAVVGYDRVGHWRYFGLKP